MSSVFVSNCVKSFRPRPRRRKLSKPMSVPSSGEASSPRWRAADRAELPTGLRQREAPNTHVRGPMIRARPALSWVRVTQCSVVAELGLPSGCTRPSVPMALPTSCP